MALIGGATRQELHLLWHCYLQCTGTSRDLQPKLALIRLLTVESEVLLSLAEKHIKLIQLERLESVAQQAEKSVSAFVSFIAKLANESQFAD
jgi:hypothetical protein